MADIEKVIEALHCRAYDDDFPCSICAYYRKDEKPVAKCDYQGLMDDAIELLKDYDKRLRKKQRDIDKLQAECSELKHKFLEKTRIVRCRDCKYWHNHGITTTCDRNAGNGFPSDWFCADGERMANNG